MFSEFIKICQIDSRQMLMFNLYFALYGLSSIAGAYLSLSDGGFDQGLSPVVANFCLSLVFIIIILVSGFMAIRQIVGDDRRAKLRTDP